MLCLPNDELITVLLTNKLTFPCLTAATLSAKDYGNPRLLLFDACLLLCWLYR